MMIRFLGRSLQTMQCKNKPIKEGYTFFISATKIGFILNFTPEGITEKYSDKNEYDTSTAKEKGKIETMVLFITGTINEFKLKQRDRIEKKSKNTPEYLIML